MSTIRTFFCTVNIVVTVSIAVTRASHVMVMALDACIFVVTFRCAFVTRVFARTHFLNTFWSTELARKVSTVGNTRTVIVAVTFGFHALPSSAAFTGQTHGSTMGVTCVRIVTVTVVMSPTGKWMASACGVTVVAVIFLYACALV